MAKLKNKIDTPMEIIEDIKDNTSIDLIENIESNLPENKNELTSENSINKEGTKEANTGFVQKILSIFKKKEKVKTENKIIEIENNIANEEKIEIKPIGISKNQSGENIDNTIENGKSVFDETKFLQDENNDNNTNNEKKGFFGRLFGSKNIDNNVVKKEIDTQNIRSFEGALKSIKYFIDTQDWEKAKKGINEIKTKEEIAFKSLIGKIDIEKEIKKQKEIYEKKIKKISVLNDDLLEKERVYIEKKENEKFKIKFAQIKLRLDELIGAKKNYEALDLINSFFDENKESPIVIKFFDKWKKVIQKNIEKEIIDQEKKSKKDTTAEALALIGERTNIFEKENEKNDNTKKTKSVFFRNLSNKLNLYKRIQSKLKEKRLLDEVTLLIESENEINESTKKKKLESMHVGLIKEIDNEKLLGYDFYAKILGKDKISGDTFGFSEDDGSYKFFLGDATGHGVQAGLIITLLTRLFHTFSKNNLLERLVYEINNGLKQDLKSKNFITGIFFDIDKKNLNTLRYIGMGHEPILIYRKQTGIVEKVIAGGLAAGIRIIDRMEHIKSRELKIEDGDIIMIYSDGIVEARNNDNELLGIDGFADIFKKICSRGGENKISSIYTDLINEVITFKGGNSNFSDDASILIVKRNTLRDVINRQSQYLKDLSVKEGLSKKNIKDLEGKTKEEIEKELQVIKREKQLKLILDNLDKLLLTGEILKLKQEAIRHIKDGFIHKKINRYLKKAIANERKYKIDLKEQKMKTKYKVLKELLKKGDYNTVIRECNEIISTDGNITI